MNHKDVDDIFKAAGIHGLKEGAYESGANQSLVRIIPTCLEADSAYCTPDLLKYNQVWTPEGEIEWQKKKRMWGYGER